MHIHTSYPFRDSTSGAQFPHINLSIPLYVIWPLVQKFLTTDGKYGFIFHLRYIQVIFINDKCNLQLICMWTKIYILNLPYL